MRFTRRNEPSHIKKWVMSHTRKSHVTHMNESRHAYESFMSHICMSPATHVNESCPASDFIQERALLIENVSLFTKDRALLNDDGAFYLWLSHVWRMNEACHMYAYAMSHICISHVPHMNESYCTYERGMSSQVRMSHDLHMMSHVTYIWIINQWNFVCHMYAWAMSHIWISHVPHVTESCPTYG